MPRWTARLAPWLAVGTSPAALLLGAEFARRHDGALPLVLLPVGALAMAAVLWPQALFGLDGHHPPRTLGEVSRAHLSVGGDRLLMTVVTASMAGWLALNLAVGGSATAAATGLPEPVAITAHGVVVLALGLAGLARWNRVAAPVAGLSALLAVALLLAGETPSRPVTTVTPALLPGDVALFVGYVAVFGVRACDFTVGLRRRRELLPLVGALVLSTLVVGAAGALAADPQATGSPLVALLDRGNREAALLLALSTLAPALAAQHSGSLGLTRVRTGRAALPVMGAVGTALAVGRFDRVFADWLVLLAVAAPPVIVPLAVERLRRARGRAARTVPWWTWIPGALAGVTLQALGDGRALPVAALLTALGTAVRVARAGRDRAGRATGEPAR